jgi:methionyl-tRNA formyltransferase
MSALVFSGPPIRRVSLLARGGAGLAVARYLASRRDAAVVSYHASELAPQLRALFPRARAFKDPASERYAAHLRLEADCVFSAHCNVVLPPFVLDAVPHPLNLHPGYLPYGRGYWPTYWAIADAVPAGTTLHRMAPLVDKGPLIARRRVPVLPTDTGETLTRRVNEAEIALVREVWPKVRTGRYRAFCPKEKGTYHDRAEGLSARRLTGGTKMTARRFVDLARAFTDSRFDGVSVDGVFLRLALHEEKPRRKR